MSISKTLKIFAVLSWLLLVVFPSQANVNPRNTGKNSDQKLEQEQVQKQQQDQEEPQDQAIDEEEETREQRQDSNSSLNYIFYMIYKVKFQDIFRFPDRTSPQNGAGLSLI